MIRLLALAVVASLLAGVSHAVDSLESLIEKEQKAVKEWAEEAEELPPAMLIGDRTGVELYSAITNRGKGNALCEPLPFDELIELSRGKPSGRETVINTDLPRVRELLQDACVVRPGDYFLAVGAGRQARVPIKRLVIRRDRASCPQDSPYSLWGAFATALDDDPIFFLSGEDVPEGDNGFLSVLEQPIPGGTTGLKAGWPRGIGDARDYDAWQVAFGTSTADRLVVLRRKTVSLDDDGLPNAALLIERDGKTEMLFMERVDVKKGSGHLQPACFIDYNKDGLTDLIVTGDHAGCPYILVFSGSSEGLKQSDFPQKPCKCP